jgi:hypothetical protein
MKTHVRLHQVKPSPRLGYLWLALGTLCSLFAANGRWGIPLAAWLGPLFLFAFYTLQEATHRLCFGLAGLGRRYALRSLLVTDPDPDHHHGLPAL